MDPQIVKNCLKEGRIFASNICLKEGQMFDQTYHRQGPQSSTNQTDGIIGLNDGIGVANSAAIGGIQVGDILGSSLDLTNTAQFVLGLLVGDPVDGVTSLDIIDQTEVFAGLFNLDDIHETSWESGISTDFAVDLDQSLFHNCLDFLGGQSVLQSVSQEN